MFRDSSAQAKCYFAQTVRAVLEFPTNIAPVLVLFCSEFAFFQRKYVDFGQEILGCIVKTLYRCIIPTSECLGKVCCSQKARAVLAFSLKIAPVLEFFFENSHFYKVNERFSSTKFGGAT